jgi:hypothetical protein
MFKLTRNGGMSREGMKILVTGQKDCIDRHLTDHLKQDNWSEAQVLKKKRISTQKKTSVIAYAL